MRVPRTAAVVTALLALGAAGCGGDEKPDADLASTDLVELTSLLPEGTVDVNAVDIAAVRSEIGLPEDADPIDPVSNIEEGVKPPEDELRLFSAAIPALPHVRFGYAHYFDAQKDPLVRSIDHSQVSAAVAGNVVGAGGGMTVLQTSQPFDEVASALEGEGWARDGDVLTSDDAKDYYPFAGDGGDGRLLLAGERGLIDDALAGDTDGPPLLDLLADIDGSVRFALHLERGPACIERAAGGETADGTDGVLLVEPVDAVEPLTQAMREADKIELSEPEGEDPARITFTDEKFTDPSGLAVRRLLTEMFLLRDSACP